MAIIRIHNPKNFTVINNDLINDSLLDWRDLGLLTYLLSKPDNWEVSVAHLQKIRKSSRDAIYTSIKAITSAGYMTGKANPKGGFNYEVYDKPQSTPLTDIPLTDIPLTDIPLTDIPLTDIPLTDIPPQVNTEYKQILKETVNTEKAVITTRPENFENFVSADDCELTIEKMGGELQQCFEWAKTHVFWNFVAHESLSKFLKLYSNKKPDGLRAQFERRNQQQAGGNNAGNTRIDKPIGAAERIKHKAALRKLEAERAERERNEFAHDDNDIPLTEYEVYAN